MPRAGKAGLIGFTRSTMGVYQQSLPEFAHSDYFYKLNYERNWLPFLDGGEPLEPQTNTASSGTQPVAS